MRAAHPEYNPNSAEENGEVAEQRPRTYVMRFELDDALEILDLVSPPHLPRAGDARLNIEPRVVVRLVQIDFGRNGRPRADQRHLALQHVKQLGQLVEARTAQQRAETGDARIADDLEEATVGVNALLQQLFATLFSIRCHRSELENLEQPSTAPHAVLPEEHRAR